MSGVVFAKGNQLPRTDDQWLAEAKEISARVDLSDIMECAKLKIWFDAALGQNRTANAEGSTC